MAASLLLGACGSDDPLGDPRRPGGPLEVDLGGIVSEDLQGQIAGAGATSQEAAMNAWIAGFQGLNARASVAYDPVGSGGGRTQFIEGGVAFAGTDAPLDADELEAAAERCGGQVAELPLYISPIAVVFNVPGVENLAMSASTIARVFDTRITRWDDPEIAAENPGVDLPDMAITPVHRSDESGTTENFVEYLHEAAGEDWPHDPTGVWPLSGAQSAQGNSGVVQTVMDGTGTIGYSDASRVGTLGTVSVLVGGEPVAYSPEAAAAVVDASPLVEDRPEGSLVVELQRDTTEAGVYPIVLISYSLACAVYRDPQNAEMVRAFLTYVASEHGQQTAATAAGAAPLGDALRAQVMEVVESIT
ncbi:phosphate ABC transporter substrate-binding protein PstS [Cellulomonas bogoriensis]|uniref:Phosphate-binding protein n=1 Tax=Cellulomonas bogoriensis 69B4 = DSM 16987 TaxID=1386082 RepID=A0A0A0BU26_9CELL|nr:phosphate ABC transporter substrate-binding protein PstS [Cellulomonas bogoriensis]KGM10639.1 phosphate ABC transporter substrate-binding protein [Cellulomonas bogoriensis 69B4 = DSM 16987]